MRYTTDYLYSLIPAVYRLRDAETGGPLRALLAVLAEQFDLVEDNIAELYDNWFVETAQEWVIPYIGDLLGVRPLNTVSADVFEGKVFSQRAWVANTLYYRRRKGTLAVIERLARDVTGWPAHAVEYFKLLGTTQFLNHVRPENVRTPDIRNADALELLNGPFEQIAHTAEVRRISSARGKYNIPNIGVHLWRVQSYPLAGVTAFRLDDHRYFFSPLGLNMPLFNFPTTPGDDLTTPLNVPMPFTRRRLRNELATQYGEVGAGESVNVILDGTPVPIEEIIVCNLSNKPDGSWAHKPVSGKVAVDPVLGRIAFPDDRTPASVRTDHCYGFSGDVGGGPYDRADLLARQLERPERWAITWRVDVIPGAPTEADQNYPTLADALIAWNAKPAGTEGAIILSDNQTYSLAGAPTIEIKDSSRLLIVAGTWPEGSRFGQADFRARTFDTLRLEGIRPHIQGNLRVLGTVAATDPLPGGLALNGLLFEGIITISSGNLGTLQIAHSTLVPGRGALVNEGGNGELTLFIERTICGPIGLPPTDPPTEPQLVISESIVQAGVGTLATAINAPDAGVDIQASTILGRILGRILNASDSIFTGSVFAKRRQLGCVRFSSIGEYDASRTPRRYRCQPDLALDARLQDLAPLTELPANERAEVLSRIIPRFTSSQYGDPGYAQLSRACPLEIRTGGEDGAEMGVFYHLKQPQREANLRTSLDEYLRAGLEAGVFFAT